MAEKNGKIQSWMREWFNIFQVTSWLVSKYSEFNISTILEL